MAHPVWIGIDVSSQWLNVAMFPATETRRFTYTEESVAALLAWLGERAMAGIAMEATGTMQGLCRPDSTIPNQ